MLVAALAITGAFAYLTAQDSAENKFTVGNVKITLTEPKWDAANPTGTLENIVAGQTIVKDPTITNVGKNDAYVYLMVEVPKVYKTDITSVDEDGETITTSREHYPLFSFTANENWQLIDSMTGTDIDAYDYYLYGYKTPVVPSTEEKTSSVTLFDEMTFANITADFVNIVTGEDIVDLSVNVTAYAIQSNFYGDEANDAESAWQLYVNQNEWNWPEKLYEGVSAVNYMSEDNELVNSEYYYEGTPITMYFEPMLTKEGYSFDWVDADSGVVAYSGMTMPEEDITLEANYTPYDTSVEAGDYFNYIIHGNSEDGYTATLYSADETSENYPTAPTTIRVPAYINVTGNGIIGNAVEAASNALSYVSEFATDENINSTSASNVWYGTDAQAINGTISIPVTEIYHFKYDRSDIETYFDLADDDLWSVIEEEVLIPVGFQKLAISFAENVILPDTITTVGPTSFGDIRHGASYNDTNVIESIRLPYALKEIPDYAFAACRKLTDITIPNSVYGIGDYAFFCCNALEELVVPKNIMYIGENAFSGWTGSGGSGGAGFTVSFMMDSLTSVTFEEPASIKDIGAGAFSCCTNLSKISIPSTVTHIGRSAFSGTAYTRNPNNYSEDGLLVINDCLIEILRLTSNGYIAPNLDYDSEYWEDFDYSAADESGYDYHQYDRISLDDWNALSSYDRRLYGGVVVGSTERDHIIKDGIRVVADGVLDSVSATSIYIPASVEGISSLAFSKTKITSVEVASENPYYTVENNILYNKDMTELIYCFGDRTEKTVNIPDTVKTIRSYAFTNSGVEKVTMTDSVTQIDELAFYQARNLVSVTLSDNLTEIPDSCFLSSTLASVAIPNGITSIGSDAFKVCNSLTEVILPNSLLSVGNGAFAGCAKLKNIDLPNSVKEIGKSAFSASAITSITIPEGVSKIEEGAFSQCNSLTDVTISEGVKEIGDSAFYYCYNITNVELPETITTISKEAFYKCKNLTVVLPASLQYIGSHAFYCYSGNLKAMYRGTLQQWDEITGYTENGKDYSKSHLFRSYNEIIMNYGKDNYCNVHLAPNSTTVYGAFYPNSNTLEFFGEGTIYDADESSVFDQYRNDTYTIVFGKGITGIESELFNGFNSVTKVEGGANITYISDTTFSGSSIRNASSDDSGVLYLGKMLIGVDPDVVSGAVVIKDGTKVIPEDAFEYCTKLTSVTIPDSVNEIGSSAFNGCINLKSVTIGNGITKIPNAAFVACYSLESIVLPEGITEIGSEAFLECLKLSEIHIPETVTSIGSDLCINSAKRAEMVAELQNMSDEEKAEACAELGLTMDWFDSFPSETVICSTSESTYAKTYAEANGYTFKVCQH